MASHGLAFPRPATFDRFLDLMVAHMNFGHQKYGPFTPQAHKIDKMASLRARLKLYEQTGNTEWLVDVANYAMMEFAAPDHPSAHYKATESNESPGNKAWGGDYVHEEVKDV